MSTKKHDIPEALLSSLLANYKKPEDLIGESGLLKQLTKLLVERALDVELTEHLGHERHEAVANRAGNTRNGKSKKTSRAISERYLSSCPATATAASSTSALPNTRPAGPALTTKSSRCTPVVQLCIVHMVRYSLNYVSWKCRKEVAADLRCIYTATTAQEAELHPGEFEVKWDADYLPIGQSWPRNWSQPTSFFDYPSEIRRVIYTTNAIESVNMGLRKLTKNRGRFQAMMR